MKNPKDVHVQFSPEHFAALKRIANDRGIYQLATLVRSVVVEALQLQEQPEVKAAQEAAQEAVQEPAGAAAE